jgi:hypothetical protein
MYAIHPIERMQGPARRLRSERVAQVWRRIANALENLVDTAGNTSTVTAECPPHDDATVVASSHDEQRGEFPRPARRSRRVERERRIQRRGGRTRWCSPVVLW